MTAISVTKSHVMQEFTTTATHSPLMARKPQASAKSRLSRKKRKQFRRAAEEAEQAGWY